MNRYEINQKVKTSLVRHAVDLSQINYSCSATTVHIWGVLKKDPEGDFTPATVELLIRELSRLPDVRRLQMNLENWEVQRAEGSWVVTAIKEKKKKPDDGAKRMLGAGEDKTLVVDKPESIETVLNDLKRPKKEVSP